MEEYCQYHQRMIGVSTLDHDEPRPFSQIINKCMVFLRLEYFWYKTFYGFIFQVRQLQRHGQPLLALNLLLMRLAHPSFWGNHTQKWWYLMYMAVNIAQNLSLSAHDKQCEPLQRLMKLSLTAPQPWQGYHAAYCFAALSLWSLAQGKTQKALVQINTSLHADPLWGYSEYLLGWYGLILEGIDSIAHFAKAVCIDSDYLQRLKQDPMIAHFPEIVEAVRHRVVESRIV